MDSAHDKVTKEKDKKVSVTGWKKKTELKLNPCSAQPGVIRGSVHITILEFYRLKEFNWGEVYCAHDRQHEQIIL